MQRIHTTDKIHRLVFRDRKNGASDEELHQKYGINKKTLQSLKEERQDVGRPLKQYLKREVLKRLPFENNLKKLLSFCRKQIKEMISSPDKEFKPLLNDYNSRKKKKLTESNRKIIYGIADLIVQTAIGVNQYSPRDSINNHSDDPDLDHQLITTNQESSVSTLNNSFNNYQYSTDNYQNDESNQVLFKSSLPQQSAYELNNSLDMFNYFEDDERNIQQYEDYQDNEWTAIKSQSETVRISRGNQQI